MGDPPFSQKMKPLNKLQNLILQIGGILLLVGAVMPLYPALAVYAPYIYTIGALMFTTMQMLNKYEGSNIIVRRLRRQQIIGGCLLIAAGAMMFGSLFQKGPFIKDEWKIALAIGAFIELYTSFRIPAVLNKDKE